jgi:hypothetical protein
MRIVLALFAFFLSTQTMLAASPGEDSAAATSLTWLALIDAKDYGGSWDQASAFFRQGVSRQRWQDMVKSVRDRLGDLKSRKLDAIELTKSLPGVPDGNYAIVRYQSVFAHKAEGSETITLILEDGAWKAGGYFIK